jgi:phosphoglycolate phosphatase
MRWSPVCTSRMRFRTVLFDFDGTLIDHFRAIHRCHVHTMRQLGLPEPTLAQVRAAVGGGFELAVKRIAGEQNVAAAVPIFRRHWDEIMLEDADVLPGAFELLRDIRASGARAAVITNKRGDSSRKLCDRLGIAPLVAGVFGAEDTPWLKPDVRFTTHVLGALGADAGSTALVGDSPYDFAAARNAGLEFFAVTTGTHSAEQLREAGVGRVFSGLPEVTRELLA